MSLVQVVDRSAFFGGRWPQGFTPLAAGAGRAFLERALQHARFVERATAEATPSWKQWIPYCVIRCADGPFAAAPDGTRGVFAVQRTRGGGEQRLHGAWSIGLGGHVEPEDVGSQATDAESFFLGALQRELLEELQFASRPIPAPHFAGLLNDDTTEVGAVHAGLVYVLDLAMPWEQAAHAVCVRETSKLRGGVTHLAGLRNLWLNRGSFESWSQMLLDAGIAGHMGDSSASHG